MKFFKKKIDFEDFLYYAYQMIFEVYEKNKEEMLDQSQWENNYKMTKPEREKLWELFIYFIPVGLLSYSIVYFDAKHPTEELAAKITKIFYIFLGKEKGYTLDKLEIFEKDFMPFIENIEEKTISLAKEGHSDILANTGIAFADIFCPNKIDKKNPMDPFATKESEMHFAALKTAKAYCSNVGLLPKLFEEFKIIYK